jgi:hypothetical protein
MLPRTNHRALRSDSASDSAFVELRLLRDRKNRCSHTLQRKGTMPMLRNRKSNMRRCDLRTFVSRHFGQEIVMTAISLETLRPSEVSLQWRLSPPRAASRCSAAPPCEPRAYQYDAPAVTNSAIRRDNGGIARYCDVAHSLVGCKNVVSTSEFWPTHDKI